MRSTFWPNRISERQSSQNRERGLKFSSKRENSALFILNCTKRTFQVMRRTIPPNRILERQSFQNCHAGLKFCWKRENSALSMKSVQNALFRSCAARFGQIAFWSLKVFKIVTLASNCLQNGKTVGFSWKLYKTLFSGHAEHVLANFHFWATKFSKSWNWPQIVFKTEKQCAFWKLYKTLFLGHAEHVLPKSHFGASKFSKSSHWPQILFKTEK